MNYLESACFLYTWMYYKYQGPQLRSHLERFPKKLLWRRTRRASPLGYKIHGRQGRWDDTVWQITAGASPETVSKTFMRDIREEEILYVYIKITNSQKIIKFVLFGYNNYK